MTFPVSDWHICPYLIWPIKFKYKSVDWMQYEIASEN